jgi:tRNA wybutosine-synthesizing protein 3
VDEWLEYKRKAWERILRDKEIGYLDPDIFDVLEVFFAREKSYTQSSCSGRISIVDAKLPWERKDSTVIYKNHLSFSVPELLDTISKGHVWRLWLIVQGPILHVYTKDEQEAWEILRLAREAGFKHSGILTINKKGILLELRTGVKMVHLLWADIGEKEAENLVNVSLEVLQKGKHKLNKLKEVIKSSVSNNPMELGEDSERKFEFHYKVT